MPKGKYVGLRTGEVELGDVERIWTSEKGKYSL